MTGTVKFLIEKGIQFPESVINENNLSEYALNYQEDNNTPYPENIENENIDYNNELLRSIEEATGLNTTEAFYAGRVSIEYIKDKLERINATEIFDKFGNKLC